MKDLTQGSILKNLLIYSSPVILGDMLQSLYNSIDAFWVGRLIGPDALAAISAASPVMFMLISLMIGIAVATVIQVGQAFGMKDTPLLVKTMSNSFITILIMVVILSAAGIIFAMPVLKLLNTPDNIINDAWIFLVIIFSGLIFLFTQNWFSGILRGLGDSMTPLIILSAYVVLNIILAPLLIAGIGPFPKLGVAGSALATVISGMITSAAALVYLAKKNPMFNILKWDYRPDFKIIKKLAFMGFPISIQMIIVSFSALVVVSAVNKMGSDITAAFGIGMRIDQFSFLPAMSLGAAASAFAAQALGAGKKEKIKEALGWSIVISMFFAVLFFAVVNAFAPQIASIFTQDAGVISHSTGYFRIITFTYFFFSLLFVFQGIIRGAGDTAPSTVIAFISLLIIRGSLAHYLPEYNNLNENGIWIAMLVSAIAAAGLNAFYYSTGRWMRVYDKSRAAAASKAEAEVNLES